jgi:hypothetical protein
MAMKKVSNSNTQTQKSTPTIKSERFLRQLHPTLSKRLLGVILAGLSIILKYQSPGVTIAFYADVSQSNQEYKAIVSVSFQYQREVTVLKKLLR